ncbi:MAG: hypothetical protein GWN94_25785, partial [Phycisphaerae bacterium]|nr:hypothetical protein [Phycisphaerae bacterium]
GFIIFGKALGTILWVKLRSSSSGSSAEKTKGKPTPLAERRKMLNNKRTAKFLEKMEEEVAGKKVADLVAPDKTVMVMCLSHLFGVNECYEHSTYAYAGDKQMLTTWEDLEKLLAADLKTIRETLWENIRPKLEQSLIYAGPVTQTPEHRRKAAEKLASIFGVDFKIMQEKIADEMPEPKSWKNLNKDGTPRKAKKAKKKTAKKSAKTKQKKGK